MRILVYGAGGVGAFFGALLARAGQDVEFVARGAQLEAMRRDGLRIRSALIGDVHVPHVVVHARARDASMADLVLVSVKTYQTQQILDDLSAVVGDTTVIVTLQNGVESDEVVASRFGWSRVVPATVYVGATIDEPAVVTHQAPARLSFGARDGFDAIKRWKPSEDWRRWSIPFGPRPPEAIPIRVVTDSPRVPRPEGPFGERCFF